MRRPDRWNSVEYTFNPPQASTAERESLFSLEAGGVFFFFFVFQTGDQSDTHLPPFTYPTTKRWRIPKLSWRFLPKIPHRSSPNISSLLFSGSLAAAAAARCGCGSHPNISHLRSAAAPRFPSFHWLRPSASGPMHVSIGPAAVKQAGREQPLSPGFVWELSRHSEATPLCIVCGFFPAPLAFPGDPRCRDAHVRRRLVCCVRWMWPCRCPYRALAWKSCPHRETLPTAQPG